MTVKQVADHERKLRNKTEDNICAHHITNNVKGIMVKFHYYYRSGCAEKVYWRKYNAGLQGS
jgi:hypothetical protein